MRGKLIVIDGFDGVGKTTIATKLALLNRGVFCKSINEQDNEKIKKASLRGLPTSAIHEISLQALEETSKKIVPLLQAGKNVVFDRYIYSCIAYYHGISHTNLEQIKLIDYSKYKLINPDIAIILTLDKDTQLDRMGERASDQDYTDDLSLNNTAFICTATNVFSFFINNSPNVFAVSNEKDTSSTLVDIMNIINSKSSKNGLLKEISYGILFQNTNS